MIGYYTHRSSHPIHRFVLIESDHPTSQKKNQWQSSTGSIAWYSPLFWLEIYFKIFFDSGGVGVIQVFGSPILVYGEQFMIYGNESDSLPFKRWDLTGEQVGIYLKWKGARAHAGGSHIKKKKKTKRNRSVGINFKKKEKTAVNNSRIHFPLVCIYSGNRWNWSKKSRLENQENGKNKKRDIFVLLLSNGRKKVKIEGGRNEIARRCVCVYCLPARKERKQVAIWELMYKSSDVGFCYFIFGSTCAIYLFLSLVVSFFVFFFFFFCCFVTWRHIMPSAGVHTPVIEG